MLTKEIIGKFHVLWGLSISERLATANVFVYLFCSLLFLIFLHMDCQVFICAANALRDSKRVHYILVYNLVCSGCVSNRIVVENACISSAKRDESWEVIVKVLANTWVDRKLIVICSMKPRWPLKRWLLEVKRSVFGVVKWCCKAVEVFGVSFSSVVAALKVPKAPEILSSRSCFHEFFLPLKVFTQIFEL